MEFFIYNTAISLLWVIGVTIYLKRFSAVESLAQLLAATAVAVLMSLTTLKLGNWDSAMYTAPVTAKVKDRVSCSHSYSCNPYQVCTGSGSSRSCTTHYRTCYEHSHDWDWDLKTELGTVTIDRIDRQGKNEPPRWTAAKIGDPVSDTRIYTNYISAAPGSLFNMSNANLLLDKYAGKLPEYPKTIYDYHYNDKVISTFAGPDVKKMSRILDDGLKNISLSKNVNIINVLVKGQPEEYADALAAKWYGGKHNDVLVVTGISEWPEIQWVRVISWSDSELFKVELRDQLEDMGTVEPQAYLDAQVKAVQKSYTHKPNSDFEYLKGFIQVPMWKYVLALVLNLVLNLGATIYRIKLARESSFAAARGFGRRYL